MNPEQEVINAFQHHAETVGPYRLFMFNMAGFAIYIINTVEEQQ